MQSKEKIIFFDIDGTLTMFGDIIPESAERALKKAKENGHKLIICTGRSRAGVSHRLEQLPFDGYVCASGGYVEYEGRIISHEVWQPENISQLSNFALKHHVLFHLQCSGKTYVLKEQQEQIERLWEEQFTMVGLPPKKLGAIALSAEAIKNAADVEKAMYLTSPYSLIQMQQMLGDSFEVTGSSFNKEDTESGEITVKGITKAHGMQKLLEYLKIPFVDSIAFGDGPNDYEMLEFAGIGIAMGNAEDGLKEKADIVTTAIDQDGIWKGLQQLGVI